MLAEGVCSGGASWARGVPLLGAAGDGWSGGAGGWRVLRGARGEFPVGVGGALAGRPGGARGGPGILRGARPFVVCGGCGAGSRGGLGGARGLGGRSAG